MARGWYCRSKSWARGSSQSSGWSCSAGSERSSLEASNSDVPSASRHFSDRAVVLLDEIAEPAWNLVCARERRLIGCCVFHFSPQTEFKSLQSFADQGFEALEFLRVAVHMVVIELTHLAENLVQIAGIDTVIAELVAKLLCFIGPVARLVAELPDFARVIDALTPAAPVIAAVPPAAI